MLIILVGMVLILLVVTGVSDFFQMPSEDWENRYFHELELREGPLSRYDLFEKPDYWEVFYLLNLCH